MLHFSGQPIVCLGEGGLLLHFSSVLFVRDSAVLGPNWLDSGISGLDRPPKGPETRPAK